jgi:hypothetical protein
MKLLISVGTLILIVVLSLIDVVQGGELHATTVNRSSLCAQACRHAWGVGRMTAIPGRDSPCQKGVITL